MVVDNLINLFLRFNRKGSPKHLQCHTCSQDKLTRLQAAGERGNHSNRAKLRRLRNNKDEFPSRKKRKFHSRYMGRFSSILFSQHVRVCKSAIARTVQWDISLFFPSNLVTKYSGVFRGAGVGHFFLLTPRSSSWRKIRNVSLEWGTTLRS